MRNYDLSPLWRSTVGFDRLFNLLDESVRWTGEDHYPPHTIERTGEDHYQISLALAGFVPEEITITAEQNMLTVEGRKAEKGDHHYPYQGISTRPFKRVFNLADYVQVKGASFDNGLLKIGLVREIPEAMTPDCDRVQRWRQRQPATQAQAGGLIGRKTDRPMLRARPRRGACPRPIGASP